MIDHILVDISSKYTLQQLQKQLQNKDLALLEDFLYTGLIDKLKLHIDNCTDWETTQTNATFRQQIAWQADSVIEEVHMVCCNLTDFLSHIYCRNLKFLGINIWKDTENFIQLKHTDNPIIEVAIQVYLTESEVELGTVFELPKDIITASYKINSGYIADNKNKFTHYTKKRVPKDHVRYSLYATWALNQ
jgi:hypothetical protein